MKKTTRTLLILFSIVLLLSACTKEASEKSDENASVKTVEMTTITDHAGNTVEIPVNPQRIASLHTMSTTVMLLGLEAPLIGTATRTKLPENKPYIRGAEEIFGIQFEDTKYFNYGGFGKDIEQIKLSKPDLIIGTTSHSKAYTILSAIAPTVIIDGSSHDLFSVYRDLAMWINKKEIFDAQNSQYKKRLQEVKNKFSVALDTQTIVYIVPVIKQNQLSVYQYYGALTKVAYDLGFKKLDFIKQNFPNNKVRDVLSAEIIDELNADYIVSTYRHQFGKDEESIYDDLDSIAPGWRTFLKAYHNDTFIKFNREMAFPTSFKSYDYVLDEFEKYAR